MGFIITWCPCVLQKWAFIRIMIEVHRLKLSIVKNSTPSKDFPLRVVEALFTQYRDHGQVLQNRVKRFIQSLYNANWNVVSSQCLGRIFSIILSVKILVIPSPVGYMWTTFWFSLINLSIFLKFLQSKRYFFLKSWSSTRYFLGPLQTMPKSRGEASLLWTKLCREEKPLG